MSLRKEMAEANIIFTVGRISSVIIGFVFSILLARMLQPYNFGLYSFCLMVANFFVFFADFGINSTLTRFTANYIGKGEKGKASYFVRCFLKIKLLLAITTGLLVSLFSSQISAIIFNKPEAGFIVFFSGFVLIVTALLEFFKSLFSGLKDFRAFSSVQVLENVFKFVIVLGFVGVGMSVIGALGGFVISYVIVNLVSFLIICKKHDFILSVRKGSLERRILMNFGIWVFIGSIVSTVYGLADQFIISILLPVEHIGFYRIAQNWMWIAIYLVPIATNVLYPYFSGSDDRERINSILHHTVRYTSIFIFPLAFLLSAFSNPLVLFLYKESYLPAVGPLSILAIAAIPSIFSILLISFFNGIKRPDVSTKTMTALVVFYVITNYLMISHMGIIGAASSFFAVKIAETAILMAVAIVINKTRFDFVALVKPMISSLLMYFIALNLLPHVTNYLTFAAFGILSLLSYLAIMLLIKGISRDELNQFIRYLMGSTFFRKQVGKQ